MRVRVGDQIGELVGLLHDERGDIQAIVRFEGSGLMLYSYHPSRVDMLPSDPPADCRVLLTHYGENKIRVIKALREGIGANLKDAKRLVEAAPEVVAKDLTLKAARRLVARLQEAGAGAEVKQDA